MNIKTNEPLRLGLAGLSHDHVAIIEHLSPADFVIVGAYEPDAAVRATVAQQLDLRADTLFDDLATMLREARPDAVAAFGPIRDHLAVVEACAPAGVHVMVEKPLAISVDHAERIAELASRHNIHVLTNYETSWYPSNQEVFRRVREGAIGVPRKVLVRDGHQGPIESGCQPQFLAWLAKPALSGGGALNDFGCYGANLMTFFMQGSMPNSVTALTRTFKPMLYGEVEDDALMVLNYDSLVAVIEASWNWPFPRKDMEIHGTTGSIIASDAQTVWLRRAADALPQPILPDPLPRYSSEPFAYLAAVVRGEEMPACDALSALGNNQTVVRILDAARRSAQAGRTISLAGTIV